MGTISNQKTKQSAAKSSKELEKKIRRTARKFLIHRGYEILQEDFEFVTKVDFICLDGSSVAFVNLFYKEENTGDFPKEPEVTNEYRKNLENLAFNWLSLHKAEIEFEEEMKIRFDNLSLRKLGDNHLMARYLKDAL